MPTLVRRLRGKSSVVAQCIARSELLNAGDAAGNANCELKINNIARGFRWINSVKSQANAHHVVVRFREANRARGIRRMNLKIMEPVCFKSSDDLIESGDLLAREIVRRRIFRGGKVSADAGKPHYVAGANMVCQFHCGSPAARPGDACRYRLSGEHQACGRCLAALQ